MNLRIMRIGGFILLFLTTTFLSAQNALQKAERLLKEDSLTAVIEEIGRVDSINVDQRSQALKILGSAYFKLRDNEKAIATYKQLLEHSQQYYKPQDVIEAIYWLTRLNAISGNFEQTLAFGQKGTKIAQLLGAQIWEFRINNFLSWAYFEQQVDFDEVLLHEKRQAELVDQIGNEMQKAQVYNNLGYDLTVAGIVPVDSAIALMTYANDAYAKNEDNKGRWYTLMNLTWQHRLKGEYEKAINYGRLSLGQAQTDNDRHAIVEASFQLGESLMAKGEVNEATKIYEIGLVESELKVDRDKYVFDVYYAKYLWETGKRKEAIERLEKAIKFLTSSEVFYEMHGRALLAEYYFQLNDVDQAQAQLHLIAKSRHNYVALESKYLAAVTQAKIWQLNGKTESAELLLENWNEKLKAINANMYTN